MELIGGILHKPILIPLLRHSIKTKNRVIAKKRSLKTYHQIYLVMMTIKTGLCITLMLKRLQWVQMQTGLLKLDPPKSLIKE
jgi:hypothetical protein